MSLIDEIAKLYDQELLRLLKDGRTTTDKTGNPIHVEANAADLNVIRQRLKDCGITEASDTQSTISETLLRLRGQGMSLPPISEDNDHAVA